MGGVFNIVNLQLYHYAGNNPVKYVDPTGMTDDISEWNIVAKWEGTMVHTKTETYLLSRFGGKAEVKIPNAGKKEGTDGRADYVNGNEIYEIKPITQQAKTEGKQQLQKYVDNYPDSGAKKGTSLLAAINGKSIGDITVKIPGVCNYTKSYRLITFTDPSEAGMIYYADQKKLDFSPLKQTAVESIRAAGKVILAVGGVVAGAVGSFVFN